MKLIKALLLVPLLAGSGWGEIIQVDTANLPPGTTEQFTPFVAVATNTSLTKAKVIALANTQAETANRAFLAVERLQLHNLALMFDAWKSEAPQQYILKASGTPVGTYWIMTATVTK